MLKHKRFEKMGIMLLLISLLVACSGESAGDKIVAGRWYTPGQVTAGKDLFQTHCAVCHGESAAGTPDWRQTDEQGVYPPPPLNGSAHAWHHPMPALQQTIANGGKEFGGTMPGFQATLSSNEIRATIAYIQSIWSDDIYLRWQEINER